MELIIAIALMDIIALTLYSSMYIGFRANVNSRAALKPHQTLTAAFEFIRADVSSVLPPNGILAGGFTGQDVPWQDQRDCDILTFYSGGNHPDEGQMASNIIKVEYALAEDLERQQMVLKRRTTKNLLAPSAVDADEEVVCRGLAGFDVKYYDGTAWLEAWDSTTQDNKLPWAVRVTLAIPKQGKSRPAGSDEERLYQTITRTFMFFSANQDTLESDQTGTQQNGR